MFLRCSPQAGQTFGFGASQFSSFPSSIFHRQHRARPLFTPVRIATFHLHVVHPEESPLGNCGISQLSIYLIDNFPWLVAVLQRDMFSANTSGPPSGGLFGGSLLYVFCLR